MSDMINICLKYLFKQRSLLFKAEMRVILISKRIVMARVSLANTQVHKFDSFISKTRCFIQRPVEAKLRSDHDSVVIQLDIAATVAKQLTSILYSVYLEVYTTFSVVSNLLSYLKPLALEGLQRCLG